MRNSSQLFPMEFCMPANEPKDLPLCQRCQSYKVTWDHRQPHSCLFFGFKSQLLPSVEVYRSCGMACPQFRLAEAHLKIEKVAQQAKDFANQITREEQKNQVSKLGQGTAQELMPQGYTAEDAPLADSPENPQQVPGDPLPSPGQDAANTLGKILGAKGILL